MNLEPRFSRTTPSEAAKKASTCETKWRSSSESLSQWARSLERSTSSAWEGGGKGKGKGSKGKPNKGGRGQGNFPAAYTPEVAQYADENWKATENWDSTEDLNQQESSSSNWYELNLAFFEENDVRNLFDHPLDNQKDAELNFSVPKTDISQDEKLTEIDFLLVLKDDLTAWTQTNAWTELDFKFSTWGDQPTLAAAQDGPGCDSLLTMWDKQTRKQQLKEKLKQLKEKDLAKKVKRNLILKKKTKY